MAIAKADMPAAALDTTWAGAIRQRRKALLQRLGMAAACALVFSPLLGWSLSVGWVLGYFSVQLLDLWIFGPVNDRRTERLRGARRFAGDIVLIVNSGYFGSLAIPMWLVGGPMGGICASMMLSAGAMRNKTQLPNNERKGEGSKNRLGRAPLGHKSRRGILGLEDGHEWIDVQRSQRAVFGQR